MAAFEGIWFLISRPSRDKESPGLDKRYGAPFKFAAYTEPADLLSPLLKGEEVVDI